MHSQFAIKGLVNGQIGYHLISNHIPEDLDLIKSMQVLQKSCFPETIFDPHLKIYIRTPLLENEKDLLPLLEKYGFLIVDPAQISLTEQISIFGQARVIVAFQGQGLINVGFCTGGSKTVVLEYLSIRDWNHNPQITFMSKRLGINHLLIDTRANEIDIEELDCLLDLIVNQHVYNLPINLRLE